jgi:predicted PurR-regulated permease PerM
MYCGTIAADGTFMSEQPAPVPSSSNTSDAAAPEAPEQVSPLVPPQPVRIGSLPLNILTALAFVLALQYAQSVLIPIVLGVLISYALTPIVGALQRLHIARGIGAAIAVTVFVGSLGLGAYTLSDQAMAIVSDVPKAAQRLRDRVRANRHSQGGALQKVQQAATEIDKAAQEAATPTPADQETARRAREQTGVQKVEVVQPAFRASDYLWYGGIGLLGFAGQFLLVLFLVYFFLVTGDLYKRKLVRMAGPSLTDKKITIQILDDINQQIASFMKVQVLTSIVVAVATAAVLWGFGVQEFVVWGLLAGIFNSIPYLGPVLVTGALGIVAFMQFDDLLKTGYVCGVTFAITSVEGFLLTPMLMGRAAQMNPVAIFVGLLFWSWVWGLWGTVLAVPLLMMLKAVCDHVEDLHPIGELLGE